VNDQFALNLDLTPTIYEAAQVDYQGSLDGVSLKKLYDGSFSRKEFYYLMLHNPNSISPVKRAIRDSHFKYIHYTCNPDTVEELFDMKNDSLELTNLINNSNYAAIANVYRLKYDSIRIAWNDTVAGPIKNCYIQNPFVLKQIFEDAEETPLEPVVYPTITVGSIEIYIPWAFALARLYDNFGKQVGEWQITDEFTQILLPDLSDGIYYMNISHAGLSKTEKLIIHAF
jgi:hypothetical protein